MMVRESIRTYLAFRFLRDQEVETLRVAVTRSRKAGKDARRLVDTVLRARIPFMSCRSLHY